MKVVHEVNFPRYHDDVMLEQRTLFHVLCEDAVATPFNVGDGLRLLAAPGYPRCKVAVVKSVDRVPLCPIDVDDLRRLNVPDAASYFARWDALHPEALSSGNPEVWRIEFEYGMKDDATPDPPEWSLAV
jgi:hypothetical protein